MKRAVRLIRRFGDEKGQAASEYALLALWTVVILWAFYASLQLVLLGAYQQLASYICLPIP